MINKFNIYDSYFFQFKLVWTGTGTVFWDR